MAPDDDEEPQQVTLLAPRHLALRLDVGPIGLLYAAALFAFCTRPELHDACAYAFPLLVGLHCFFVLAPFWSVELRSAAHFRAVTDVREATAVKIVPATPGGRRQLCRLLRMRAGSGAAVDGACEGAHFYWQRRKYVLAPAREPGAPRRFERAAYPTGLPLAEYLRSRGVASSAEALELCARFGPNAFAIPEPSFAELYAAQLLAPFFVFQLCCVGLWSLDDYWLYSLFTLLMLALFEGTVVAARIRTLSDLRLLAPRPQPVFALRGGRWQRLLSSELVPGDLVSVSSPAAALASGGLGGYSGEGEGGVLCADMLLLHGSAVVNEAMLTGESVPQLKEPPEAEAEQGGQRLDLGLHRSHLLHAGTSVLLSAPGDAPKGLRTPDGGAVGYVLRTGYATTQGRLLRTILFAKEPVSANNLEVLVYILCLLGCALLAAGHVLAAGWADEATDRHKLLLHCTMVGPAR